MIWSVDQDTTDFDALSGLVGKELESLNILEKDSVAAAGSWASQNGQDCKMTDCLKDSEVGSWGSGFAMAPNGGAFKDTCGSGKNKYIICPTDAMPSTCQWRGGETGRSCHGQCHAAEVTLFHSKHATVSCYAPGYQAFCCESNTWSELLDSCGWSNDDTCGSSRTWVAMRKAITGYDDSFNDYEAQWTNQAYCCDTGLDQCHWIGKGTCDDNECADYEIEMLTDTYGNTTSQCAAGLNGRSKVLCCTPPAELNPFLPVELSNIFPTLPPSTDIPDFDLASIKNLQTSSSSDTVTGAFGFVVIDGPSDVVTSLTSRDESHIQFLDCDSTVEKRDASSVYTVRYICMDESSDSNCDNIHEGGAKGTIVKLPEGCGFATYGVVTGDIRPSKNFTVEPELLKRTPSANPVVHEMSISYDYSLVKRASSDVYVRIDYGDTRSYWVDVVQGAPVTTKRGFDDAEKVINETLYKRFWSKTASDWASEFHGIRTSDLPSGYYLDLTESDFNKKVYLQDDSANCGGQDGFMAMYLSGTVTSDIRFGVTMVGTISPTLNLEEAYGFFDADMTMVAALTLNGQGSIDINGATKQSNLFATDISDFGYSEPGIVSFAPKMNVGLALQGQGTVNVDGRLGFSVGSDGYVRTNAPLSLGDLSGDVQNLATRNAWSGTIDGAVPDSTTSSKRQSGDSTLFGLRLDLQTWLEIEVFELGTNDQAGNAQFLIDIPHDISIMADGDVISIVSGDETVGAEVYSAGISDEWEEDDTLNLIGSTGTSYIVFSGAGDPPPSRTPPDSQDDGLVAAISGNYFGCSNNDTATSLVCYASSNMSSFDPDWLTDPETGDLYTNEKRRRSTGDLVPPPPSYHLLDPRGTGGKRNFTVKTPSGATFIITSHTYPNGQNGAYLLTVNVQAGYYNLAAPNNCVDASVTANGVTGGTVTYVTEHIVELGTLNLLLQFMMFGTFTLPDGSTYSVDPSLLVPEAYLDALSLFQTPWNQWDPSSTSTSTPIDDIWSAFGDTNNAGHLVNCESVFNGVKMQIWQGNNPMSDNTWKKNNFMSTSEANGYAPAEGGLSTIRLAIAIFEYLNDAVVNANMATTMNAIHATFANYDASVLAVTGNQINTARLAADFVYGAMIPRLEGVQAWAIRRINTMITDWEAALNQPTSSARANAVGRVLTALRSLLATTESLILIDTTGFDFEFNPED
jgi:hypothetical protein